ASRTPSPMAGEGWGEGGVLDRQSSLSSATPYPGPLSFRGRGGSGGSRFSRLGGGIGPALPPSVLRLGRTRAAAVVERVLPVAGQALAQEASLGLHAGAPARLGREVVAADGAGDGVEARDEVAGVEECREGALGIARQLLVVDLDGMRPAMPALQG